MIPSLPLKLFSNLHLTIYCHFIVQGFLTIAQTTMRAIKNVKQTILNFFENWRIKVVV